MKRTKRLKRLRLELAKWLLWKNFMFTETPDFYWKRDKFIHEKYLAYASFIILMFDVVKIGFYSKKQGKLIRLKKLLRRLD